MPNKKKAIKKRSAAGRLREKYSVGKKLVKKQGKNNRVKVKSPDNRSSNCGSIPVTPQMIRLAVKELLTRRVFVKTALIAEYLSRHYPVNSNPTAFKRELDDKLEVAVSVGLISQCSDDTYCLPTLRQQAMTRKTAFSVFWKRYYSKCSPRSRRINGMKNVRKKEKIPVQRGLIGHSDDDSVESDTF